MIKHNEFFTISLAKTYSSQGHDKEALEIYRYLLQRSPDNQALKDAISELENSAPKSSEQTLPKKSDLDRLIETWIKWIVRYKTFMTLKRLKSQRQQK
jgi:hypothetical protein